VKRETWRAFTKQFLLPSFEGGHVVGELVLVPSNEWLCRGFAVESSGFSAKRFTIDVFVLPLYVPVRHVHFTYGGRVGSLSGNADVWWDLSRPGWEERASNEAITEARNFFDAVNEPRDLANYISEKLGDRAQQDPREQEAIAYSRILSGESVEAIEALKRGRELADARDEEWAKGTSSRMGMVDDRLRRGLPAAIEVLDHWREENRQVLRLPAIAS